MNRLYDKIKVADLFRVMDKLSFKIFTDTSKNYNLNIVNIRNSENRADKFDDLQVLFWLHPENNVVEHIRFDVTTDPGIPHLLKPLNSKGTAIVAPGQYKGVWRLGKHKGKYDALVQAKPITVIRDNNKNELLDGFDFSDILTIVNDTDYTLKDGRVFILDHGYFGINCHRASAYGIKEKVGLYSAGCCVHQDPKGYDAFIDLCKASAMLWGNSFTATWITEKDYDICLTNTD